MLTAKKRISKKEIKQDKLVTSYYKFYNYFLQNQAKFLIGIAAAALIVVAIVLMSNKRANDNLTATNLLSKVVPLYDNGSYQAAIDGDPKNNIIGLKEIVNEYGSTEQGETAKIYLANCYVILGKIDEAFEQFADYSGSNELFIAASKAGQASYYETKKEYEKAADLYREAASISTSNPSKPEYLMKSGINLLQLGKKTEALKLFQEIKKDYKTSYVVQDLDRYIVKAES